MGEGKDEKLEPQDNRKLREGVEKVRINFCWLESLDEQCDCTVTCDCVILLCVQEVAELDKDDTAATTAAEPLSRVSTYTPSATAVSAVSLQYQEEERSSKTSELQDDKELKEGGDSTAADVAEPLPRASMCASAAIAMLFVSCLLNFVLLSITASHST